MIDMPKQLMNPEFRFIRTNGKIPIDTNWQDTNNYSYDSPILSNHINSKKSYGIATGYGNLVVVDLDNALVNQTIIQGKLFPETFTIKTAGKGLNHFYFYVDDPQSFKIMDENKITIADIQGKGKQVIGPGTIINGKSYEVVNDVPIVTTNIQFLRDMLSKFGPITQKEKKENWQQIMPQREQDNTVDEIKRRQSISGLLLENGIDISVNPTRCPLHTSMKGKCLSFDDNKGLWKCFHCDKGGDVINLYQLIDNSDFLTTKKKLMDKLGIKEIKPPKQQKNKKGDEEKEETPKINSLQTDNEIVEEILVDGQPKFIVYNKDTNETKIQDNYMKDEITYKPQDGDEIKKGAVLLPTGAEDYKDEISLDNEIEFHLRKWLDIDENDYKRMVWQIRFSWVYDKFHALNYARALGDTGTGKSRFLNAIGHLHYTPMIVAGALTPAVIFRIINKWKGTLIIDEGDQKSSEETDAFIKILNCGYEKGMPVSRCNKDNKMVIEFFDIYCPKVLSTRKSFTDKATEARCMTVIMRQTGRQDIREVLTKDYFKEVERLRKKLLMYRLKNWHKIDPEKAIDVDISFVEPRLRQVNRSFMSLFMDDPVQLQVFKDYLNKYQERILNERAESFDGEIVNSLARLVASGKTHITAKDVVDDLNENEIHFTYEINSKSVNKCLRGLGLEIRLSRLKGSLNVGRFIVLDENVLVNVFRRYVINPDLVKNLGVLGYVLCNSQCNSVTDVTIVTDRAQNLKIEEKMGKNEVCNENGSTNRDCYNRYTVTSEEKVGGAILRVENGEKIQKIEVNYKCVFCDLIPCVAWNKSGQPVCEFCADSLQKNGEYVSYQQ